MHDASPELAHLLRELARSLAWQRELGALGVPLEGAHVAAETAAARHRPGAHAAAAGAPTQEPALSGSEPGAPEPLGETLESVRDDLGDCRRCKLCEGRRHIVFGAGHVRADLMFIGEAPGADEDRQGIPFVGRAGQLLTRMISAMGLTRDQVYIANIIKCRPPRNRDPEPDEVLACEPFLLRQIDAIQPKLIVSLGRVSAQTLLRVRTPIGRLRGRWRDYHGVKLMPTFHPAYLLRNPEAKREVWEDLQKVMAELGLERPSSAR